MQSPSANRKVLVGLSGGVDSAVAAALLQEAGCEVHGAFLCLGLSPTAGGQRSCCSPRDAHDARRAAERLGVPFTVLDAGEAMEGIIRHCVEQYVGGRTPNPCPLCNAAVKFAALAAHADSIGAQFIATGHYARAGDVGSGGMAAGLRRARCRAKDQSYVLFAARPEQIGRLLLPIGELEDKSAVRRAAQRRGLELADKPDSQDVCFVPEGGFGELLELRLAGGMQPGPILDPSGRQLGTHAGSARYTIGQRRGLRVAGGEPLYVVEIDPAANTIVLGRRELLRTRGLSASGACWLVKPAESFTAEVQFRSAAAAVAGRVTVRGEGGFDVEFLTPADCVVPGQAAVLYDGDVVIGGGWIDSVRREPQQ